MSSRQETAAFGADDVVTIGEPIVALIGLDDAPLAEVRSLSIHETGSELNVAVGLRRLGNRVAYVGVVGRDALGERLLRRMRGEGIDVSCVRVDERGTALLLRDLHGGMTSQVVYRRHASAGASLSEADVAQAAERIASARWLHVTGITPALGATAGAALTRAVAIANEADVPVSIDINFRANLWTWDVARTALEPLIARSKVVFASRHEALALSGADDLADAVMTLVGHGIDDVVITDGSAGVTGWFASSSHDPIALPAHTVTAPVDVVGAGDAFVAGYLDRQLAGAPPLERLRAGNAAGAAVVRCRGDFEGFPTGLLALGGAAGEEPDR